MKLIPDSLRRCWRRLPRWCAVLTVSTISIGLLIFALAELTSAKWAGALSMVSFYFVHLGIGVGAGVAILRLWHYRDNPLIARVAVYMSAMVIGAVMAVVLLFMARGVKLTWKFALVWFAGTLLMDAVRVPLIFYLCKGETPDAPAQPADMTAPS